MIFANATHHDIRDRIVSARARLSAYWGAFMRLNLILFSPLFFRDDLIWMVRELPALGPRGSVTRSGRRPASRVSSVSALQVAE